MATAKTDERIRSLGYRIKARPNSGPVLWEKKRRGVWVTYTQAEVMKREKIE